MDDEVKALLREIRDELRLLKTLTVLTLSPEAEEKIKEVLELGVFEDHYREISPTTLVASLFGGDYLVETQLHPEAMQLRRHLLEINWPKIKSREEIKNPETFAELAGDSSPHPPTAADAVPDERPSDRSD